jgi:hypothetical protein
MYKKRFTKNPSSPSKAASFMIALIPVALILTAGYIYIQSDRSTSSASNDTSINYSPPTAEEQIAGDNQKTETITKSETILPDEATIVISESIQKDQSISVRAFVTNSVKDGTCDFVFTNGDSTFEQSVEAVGDASSALCYPVSVPVSELGVAGSWDLTVSYTNSEIQGSTTISIEVTL